MPLWKFWVPGYAIWSNQCTCYVSVLHEPHIQGSIEEISLGFLRRHLGLQQDMAGAYEALGWGIEHHEGIVIICQRVQVWVRYDRATLLRPHIQCIGVIGEPREDQGHSGLANAQECDRVEELLRVMQLLHVVHQGFFLAWSTTEGSQQAWGFHLDRWVTKSLRSHEGSHGHMSNFSITRLHSAICIRVWCIRWGYRDSFDVGRTPHYIRETEA